MHSSWVVGLFFFDCWVCTGRGRKKRKAKKKRKKEQSHNKTLPPILSHLFLHGVPFVRHSTRPKHQIQCMSEKVLLSIELVDEVSRAKPSVCYLQTLNNYVHGANHISYSTFQTGTVAWRHRLSSLPTVKPGPPPTQNNLGRAFGSKRFLGMKKKRKKRKKKKQCMVPPYFRL